MGKDAKTVVLDHRESTPGPPADDRLIAASMDQSGLELIGAYSVPELTRYIARKIGAAAQESSHSITQRSVSQADGSEKQMVNAGSPEKDQGIQAIEKQHCDYPRGPEGQSPIIGPSWFKGSSGVHPSAEFGCIRIWVEHRGLLKRLLPESEPAGHPTPSPRCS
jgi:hypothetical protein